VTKFHGSQPLSLGLNQRFFGESEPLTEYGQGQEFIDAD
jgi:hypothetical protein